MSAPADRPRSLLRRSWLPVAILGAVGVGLWQWEAGRRVAESGAVGVLVPLVMFLVSLRVEGSRLWEALRHPLPLLGSLVVVFGLYPLVALGWRALLGPPGPDGLAALMILAAQPSTLATASVLTQVAGGNVALALVCTVTSQALSTLFTPWLLALYLGASVPVDSSALMRELLFSVLLPVTVAQGVRLPFRAWLARHGGALGIGAESVVVFFAFLGFATARPVLVAQPRLAAAALALVVLIHLSLLALSAAGGILLRLDGRDRIAFTLASSQKTLAAGVLVWRTGFAANSLGPILVILHHVVQILIDSLLAPHMSRLRVGKHQPFRLT